MMDQRLTINWREIIAIGEKDANSGPWSSGCGKFHSTNSEFLELPGKYTYSLNKNID